MGDPPSRTSTRVDVIIFILVCRRPCIDGGVAAMLLMLVIYERDLTAPVEARCKRAALRDAVFFIGSMLLAVSRFRRAGCERAGRRAERGWRLGAVVSGPSLQDVWLASVRRWIRAVAARAWRVGAVRQRVVAQDVAGECVPSLLTGACE